MNKLWLIIINKDNVAECKQIDILEEHTIKYKLKAETPFNSYNYIHKHNLNIVQHNRKERINYVVSLDKNEGIEAINNYTNKKLEYHKRSIDKLECLQRSIKTL